MATQQAASETVLCEISEGVAHVILNRPQAANTMDLALATSLAQVALRCERDSAVRAVWISGAGSSFSAGGDLKTFSAQGDGLPDYLREVTTHLHLAVSRFAGLNAPVIAAVHGAAAGGGFSLACGCDIVLAAESSTFLMAYTKIGLVPDGGSTYYLPRLVGLKRAMELALLNRKLSAQEACQMGIVTEVVPDADLMARAEAMAAAFAAGPTGAFGVTKRMLHGAWSESLASQLEIESRAMAAAAATHDGKEGIAAFLGKRAARYSGQ